MKKLSKLIVLFILPIVSLCSCSLDYWIEKDDKLNELLVNEPKNPLREKYIGEDTTLSLFGIDNVPAYRGVAYGIAHSRALREYKLITYVDYHPPKEYEVSQITFAVFYCFTLNDFKGGNAYGRCLCQKNTSAENSSKYDVSFLNSDVSKEGGTFTNSIEMQTLNTDKIDTNYVITTYQNVLNSLIKYGVELLTNLLELTTPLI